MSSAIPRKTPWIVEYNAKHPITRDDMLCAFEEARSQLKKACNTQPVDRQRFIVACGDRIALLEDTLDRVMSLLEKQGWFTIAAEIRKILAK